MTMKLLERTARLAQEGPGREDVVVLHINHCMDNTFYFNDILKSLFGHVTLVTPPYNNRGMQGHNAAPYYHGVYREGNYHLMRNGVGLGRCAGDFLEATLLLLEEAICRELVPLLRQGKKLLILEDGGYHFEALARVKERFPEVEGRIIGVVEQTTSGTRRSMDAQGYRYAYPCASVARSMVKMHWEAIFIGQRVVEELGLMLYAADAFYSFHTVLLVGYGVVGRSCRRALEGRLCQMEAFDIDPEALQAARADALAAFPKPVPEMFPRDTILIGCVGRPSFGEEMFWAFLEGRGRCLYLASGSSQDVEFSYFLRYLAGKEAPIPGLRLEGQRAEEWFDCYQFCYGGVQKTVYLMAGGKPVNFRREGVISLTYRVIDLVFTEMLSLALYLCSHRDMAPQLYMLGEDNPITRAVCEQELLAQWFGENDFWCPQELRGFLPGWSGEQALQEGTGEEGSGQNRWAGFF